MADAAVGGAIRAFAEAANTSEAVGPATGSEKTPAGYAEKADVLPVAFDVAPAQPALKTHAPPVHAGQLPASPNVVSAPPVAAHEAVVMSGHDVDPARDVDPGGHGVGAAEPARQKDPDVHAFVVPDAWPATQKKPAGHFACTVDASVDAGQKNPGLHGFAELPVLAVARHEPGAHAPHDEADVYDAPPVENVPDGHAFVVPTDWPATQKCPGGQRLAVALVAPAAQK